MESLTKNDEEISFSDFLCVIIKHVRLIIGIFIVSVIVAAIVSLLLPKQYSATATIMPPQNQEGMASLASKLEGIAGIAGGIFGLGGADSAEVYIDMLKSRTITDEIIQRFNMLSVYDVELMEDAREKLADSILIKTSKANSISISVQDRDPQRTADIANAYIEELDKLNQRLNLSNASRKRKFLEKRLDETRADLASAEKSLKEFQQTNRIVALEEQAKAAITGAAQIKGEIIATEIEIESLRGFATENKNKVIILKQKLRELKEQLARIEHGTQTNNNPDNFYISFAQAPSLGLQLSRLMREVKIQETIFELLTQQYEMAKIAQAKDTAIIQVLDRAVVPRKKSKPRRTLLVVVCGLIALFGSIVLAFLYEYILSWDNNRNELAWDNNRNERE